MQFDYFPNVKRLNKRQKQFIIPRVLKELTKDVEHWVKDGEIEYVLPLKLYKDRYGYAVVDQEESWVSQLTRCPRCGCIDHDITLGEGDIYVCWCGLTISGDRSFVESSGFR